MPATPTKTALERKPQAVVMQQFVSDHPDTVHTLSFEWFETDKGRVEWFDETYQWMVEDVSANGDIFYTITEVVDTKTMALGRVCGVGTEANWEQHRVDLVNADPSVLIAPPVVRKTATTKKATPRTPKVAKVKGRSQSPAASVIQGDAEVPVVRSKVVRKKIVVPQTGDEKTEAPEMKAAALKEKLAKKQAEAPESKIVQPSMGLARLRRSRRS